MLQRRNRLLLRLPFRILDRLQDVCGVTAPLHLLQLACEAELLAQMPGLVRGCIARGPCSCYEVFSTSAKTSVSRRIAVLRKTEIEAWLQSQQSSAITVLVKSMASAKLQRLLLQATAWSWESTYN